MLDIVKLSFANMHTRCAHICNSAGPGAVLVAADHEGAGLAEPRQKKRRLTEEEKNWISEHEPKPIAPGVRMHVSLEAKAWMWAEVEAWRAQHNTPPDALPFDSMWYKRKRVEGIGLNLLSDEHCWDTVRNVVRVKTVN